MLIKLSLLNINSLETLKKKKKQKIYIHNLLS